MTKPLFKTREKELNFSKYLGTLVSILTVLFILPTILLRNSINLPITGVIPISIFFTGTYFIVLDIITEVYGYKEAKKGIYTALFGYTLFVLIIEFVINISPIIPIQNTSNLVNNNAYILIFSNIYQTWLSVTICTFIFDIFNIRLLSKLKFLFNGKYFILRSIGSSSTTIILFSTITCCFAFFDEILKGNYKFYLTVTIVSITAKIISLIIFAIPASIICKYLKKTENIDITRNSNIFLFNKDF